MPNVAGASPQGMPLNRAARPVPPTNSPPPTASTAPGSPVLAHRSPSKLFFGIRTEGKDT